MDLGPATAGFLGPGRINLRGLFWLGGWGSAVGPRSIIKYYTESIFFVEEV